MKSDGKTSLIKTCYEYYIQYRCYNKLSVLQNVFGLRYIKIDVKLFKN